MSNVVQFLEALARNPVPLSTEDYVIAVARSNVTEQEGAALLNRDARTLAEAVGSRASLLCFIVPAENDEPQQDEEQDGDKETPAQEESRAA